VYQFVKMQAGARRFFLSDEIAILEGDAVEFLLVDRCELL
jgi:hypothetical protein